MTLERTWRAAGSRSLRGQPSSQGYGVCSSFPGFALISERGMQVTRLSSAGMRIAKTLRTDTSYAEVTQTQAWCICNQSNNCGSEKKLI